jgi:hypothetical protein
MDTQRGRLQVGINLRELDRNGNFSNVKLPEATAIKHANLIPFVHGDIVGI